MILMIDNYDSFTYNLVQYLGEIGEEVKAKVKELFGSDAWMRLGLNIDVIADRHSKKYKEKKKMIAGNIHPFILQIITFGTTIVQI